MRAYSHDLRLRVVAAYERSEGSHAELAKRFELSEDTVRAWCIRKITSGSLAPLPHGGGAPRRLSDEDRDHVARTALERNDATLEELRDDLAMQRGVTVSIVTIHTLLKQRSITRKKRPGVRASVKTLNGKPDALLMSKK